MKYDLLALDGSIVAIVDLPIDVGGMPDADLIVYRSRYFGVQYGGYAPAFFQEVKRVKVLTVDTVLEGYQSEDPRKR